MKISAQNVSKSFGAHTVIRSVSLEADNEIFGLLGPSGAGKTTLIRILTGQLAPDSGRAQVGGFNCSSLKGGERRRFGIMMDDFGVYDRLTCYENLKVFARIYGIIDDMIYSALDKVGLSDAAKTPAMKLSKGMTGRLRLARAFMTDPDILFLDEPTSGLDPVSANEIHKLLIAEKEKGKTIFLTTHIMSEAEKLCTHIALLCDGRIIEHGTPQEICRRYDECRQLRIHLADGTDTSIPHDRTSADKIAELIGSGRAVTIHTTEPDLETVFMKLTGKELSA